jgi:hypothetical protein
MLPRDLKSEQFAAYPPQARQLAAANLGLLQRLPLSFLPAFLRELSDYDYKFPEERKFIDAQLSTLSALPPPQLDEWFQSFAQLTLSPKLERMDWVNQPALFLEGESAHLWTTRQQDAFRKAAMDYEDRLHAALPAETLPMPRLGIAVIGQGVASYDAPLFANLRAHGTYFGQVNPQGGLDLLLQAAAARAKAHPVPYAHWYVDGGTPAEHSSQLTCVSYAELAPVRTALLNYMQKQIERPGMGPEELRSNLARLAPADIGMNAAGDPVLDRFQLKLLTEGSGTQIFSTTFAQWTAREALRRAQPLTLVVRFAPRQRQRPMNELLSPGGSVPELDAEGSLVDADMGAWYQWINQQRLAGADRSSFVVWFEGHSQALAIGPTLPRGAESHSPLDLGKLLNLALS